MCIYECWGKGHRYTQGKGKGGWTVKVFICDSNWMKNPYQEEERGKEREREGERERETERHWDKKQKNKNRERERKIKRESV